MALRFKRNRAGQGTAPNRIRRASITLLPLLLAVVLFTGERAYGVLDTEPPPRQERTGVLYTQGGWTVRVYDPTTDAWIDLETPDPIVTVVTGNLRDDSLAAPPNLRDQPDSMPLNNGVLIATTRQVYYYEPTANNYVTVDLPPGEQFTGANVADRRGEVLAVAHTNRTAYIYNASQNAWSQAPPLSEGVIANLTQVSPTGAIVASQDRALVYDTVRNDWMELNVPSGQTIQATGLPAMPEPGLTPIVLTQENAYTYDGGTDTWVGHKMPGQIRSYAVAEASPVVASDRAVAVYDPVTNQWVQQDAGPNETIPRSGVLASRNTALALTDQAGYFYSRSRHQWEQVDAPANQSFSGFAVAENTGLYWTQEGSAFVFDVNRQEFVEASAPPNATIVSGTMNQNLAVLTTDQGAMVYDPGTNQWSHFQVPVGDIPNPPGAPACRVSRFTTMLNTNTNAWVWNPGTHQFDAIQTDGHIRMAQTSENAAVVATDNGAYVYDPTLNQWVEIKTPLVNEPIAGVDTARNTTVARSEDRAWFFNRSTHQWAEIEAPPNETWNVQMALENTALVCSERHAAVWDPTQDQWVQLEAGGDVSVLRDGNSFMVVTDYSAFVYNRSRHEWQETTMPYGGTAQGGRRQPIPCKPGKKEEEDSPDREAVVQPPPDDPDKVDDPGDEEAPDRSVVLVLDASGSMDDNNKIEDAKAAAKELLHSLTDAEVALIVYYDCFSIDVEGFTQDVAALEAIIDGVYASGGTPLYKSIGMAFDLMQKKASAESGDIIVLTDGGESCQEDEDRNREAAASWSQRRIPWARRTQKATSSASVSGSPERGVAAQLPVRVRTGLPATLVARAAQELIGPEAAYAQQTLGQINLHLVGFQVVPEVETMLQEMMEQAQGVYHPAGDVTQLTEALKTAAGTAASSDVLKLALLVAVSLVALAAILFFVLQISRRRRPAPIAAPAGVPPAGPPFAPPGATAPDLRMLSGGRLVVTSGQPAGTVVNLDAPVVTIGRDPSCTLSVVDQIVSRFHAQIRRQDGAVVLLDMGSRNGTFVNGQRLAGTRPLHPGDVIRVGDIELVYQPGAAQTAPQAGARLTVVQGTSRPPSFDLRSRPVFTIGRAPSCDVVIDGDALVSRQHAQIRSVPLGHGIVDMGSANGTFVNGQRIPGATLRPGDRIQVGNTVFLYQS